MIYFCYLYTIIIWYIIYTRIYTYLFTRCGHARSYLACHKTPGPPGKYHLDLRLPVAWARMTMMMEPIRNIIEPTG